MLVLEGLRDLAEIDVIGPPKSTFESLPGERQIRCGRACTLTREWSGNPAVIDCYALRPVALRPRLSAGLPLSPELKLDLRCL